MEGRFLGSIKLETVQDGLRLLVLVSLALGGFKVLMLLW